MFNNISVPIKQEYSLMDNFNEDPDMNNEEEDDDDGYIVKLRGLPWSATAEDITKFLGDEGIKKVQLTLSKEGRPSGEAFVELETEEDLMRAEKKDKEHMGTRYIEVFKVNRAEMDWVMKRSGNNASVNEDGCVRLRGLPFGCSKEEIAQFFTGLEIVANGITLLTDFSGRSSGEAYVQFANREVAERALQKHREKIGHRYIEIFRSSLAEVNEAMGGGGGGYGAGRGVSMPPRGGGGMFGSRPGPYDRGDRFGGGGPARFAARGSSRSFKSVDPWGGPPGQNGGPQRGGMNKRFDDDFEYDSWGPPNRPVQNHCIHMRGLPFKASQQDIAEFFRPIIPMTIHILSEPSGRPSGEADVCFATHEDALKAMSKDKSHMQHRYIELFLNSSGQQGGMGTGMNRFRR